MNVYFIVEWWNKSVNFCLKISPFLIKSFSLPLVTLCVGDDSHEKLMTGRLRWGSGGWWVRVCCSCHPLYLLFSGPRWLHAALVGLCLLSAACNQLLFLSLWRELDWTEECALSLFQHVWVKHEREHPWRTQRHTHTQPFTMIIWAYVSYMEITLLSCIIFDIVLYVRGFPIWFLINKKSVKAVLALQDN